MRQLTAEANRLIVRVRHYNGDRAIEPIQHDSSIVQLGRQFSLKGITIKRHISVAMAKHSTIIPLVLLAISALAVLAQEPDRSLETDRIRSVIAEVNKALSRSDAAALSRFFTVDATLRSGQFVATGRAAIVSAFERQRSAWSEVTPAFIETEAVTFVSADTALVDATQTQYGSMILKRSVPIVLLMKLDGKEWRILSMRLLLSQGGVIGAGR